MVTDDRATAVAEMERFRHLLDAVGIEHEDIEPHYVKFRNANGTCLVWPSQAREGMLVATYTAKGHCTTAEEVLGMCMSAIGADGPRGGAS